ncbi:hypothetical protein ACFWXI_06760 [[Kitasatospora] papulosa]|uniref:hypothetical protein n=1 Tax=[Kitasatospora] papulosa TaxID=1464011 RepID=UPI0036BEEC8F
MTDQQRVLGQIERGEVLAGRDAARQIAARHEAAYGSAFTDRAEGMAALPRRAWLARVIAAAPGVWTTQRAEHALAASPFSCHRNTARKDLRALVARGVLVAADRNGRRIYTPAPVLPERNAA